MMTNETRNVNVEGHTTSTAHRLLHYDGACNNVHGHNMEWNVSLVVTAPQEEDQMAVDFKKVTDQLDVYDHAIVLNEEDPLVNAPDGVRDLLGDVITVEGDPTCENLSQIVADRFEEEFDCVMAANVKMAETDKYSMSTMGTVAGGDD